MSKPLDKASKALILLHGRGSSTQDIMRLAPELCDDDFFIAAPNAKDNTWYPNSFMADEKTNEPWLSSSIGVVKGLIDHISEHISHDKIFLVGFSQGACLVLETSSRYAMKYGGVVAFTGGLIGNTVDVKKYNGDFKGTKVFIGNSDRDPHVPVVRSEQSKAVMEKLGAQVTLKVYEGMGHTVTKAEIDWVKQNIF